MYIFIWERVDELTTFYHPEGGLIIVADSIENAEKINPRIKGNTNYVKYKLDGKYDEQQFVFPDSGCC